MMDIDVERNGYGRQIDSRIAKLDLNGDGDVRSGVHPRADHPPRGPRASNVIAKYNGDPVWVEQGPPHGDDVSSGADGRRARSPAIFRKIVAASADKTSCEGLMDAVLKAASDVVV